MKVHLRPAVVNRTGFLLLVIIIFSCNSKAKLIEVDPAFSQYIDAYTSGVVSKKNTIRIQLASDVSTTHTVNEAIKEKLFNFSPAIDGNYIVNVLPGIENQWGDKTEKAYSSNVFFENRLPNVKIKGNRNILPNSTGKLVLPFEAINLKAIDVSIIKIYENNIAQFLQMNDMNGSEDLRRVGKPIKEATIRLDDDKSLNLHHKNAFALDLDKFIRTEPGAIYRVTIGFRLGYSLYTCDSLVNDKDDDEDWDYYNTSNENVVDDNEEILAKETCTPIRL